MNDFSKKICFALVLLLFAFATACGSSGQDGGSPPPPEAPEKVNPLTANRWCRAEDWDDFQVVMRMTIRGQKLQTEYLRLTPSGFDVYQYGEPVAWEAKGQMAAVPNKIMVTLHEAGESIKALPGFEEQKRIVKDVFSLNSNLKHPEGEFAPAVAMTTVTRALSTGFEIERNVYPCESFSSTLNDEGPARPLIEMILIFASNSKSYTDEGRGTLAATMPFAYPINQEKIETANIANTQWCSWREVRRDELLLKTLTIGDGVFVENAHSQVFANYFDETELKAYLQSNAARSEKYQMSIVRDRLAGKNQTPADTVPRHPVQELFTMVTDTNGSKILVRMDPQEPDRSWPVFSDLYYSCQDPRPLQFSSVFATRLPDILALQTQQLQPVVTPPPPPIQ